MRLRSRTLYIFLLLLAMVLTLGGCQPETGDTIVLIGEEADFRTPQQLMEGKISIAQQEAFLSELQGMPDANTGVFPPDVMGSYKISPKQFLTSNIGFDFFDDDRDVLFRVFHQQNCLATVDFLEGEVNRIDNAYLIGQEDVFSLYFTEEREVEFMGVDYRYERLVMITGRKDSEGIRDLSFGNVILKVENGDDPLVGDFEPGWFFIYKDADGLSELGDWF